MKQPSPISPIELGVIRRLARAELRPVFGRYRPAHSELFGRYLLLTALLATIAYFITSRIGPAPSWVSILAAIVGACLGVFAELFDAASFRVLSEQEVALVAPLKAFSWSVPFAAIQHCDVVQWRSNRHLRIRTSLGPTRSLPLTDRLWDLLAGG